MDLQAERKIWRKGFTVIGLDEAGRGPLAGPVVAAAVAVDYFLLQKAGAGLKREFKLILKETNDSKKLSCGKRELLYGLLTKNSFISWGIASVSEKKIDKINIFQSSRLAMVKALDSLNKKNNSKAISAKIQKSGKAEMPYLFIDGNFTLSDKRLIKAGFGGASQKPVPKGDQKIFSIAAASILAKVCRDRIMERFDKKYPQYGFARHKGYPTKYHKEMLKNFGPAAIHRKSFQPVCFHSKIN